MDGDLRRVACAFSLLKRQINLGPSSGGFGDNQLVKNSTEKQFQITPDEILRLKDVLEQRDAEINVLTALLKKEKQRAKSNTNTIIEEKYKPDNYSDEKADLSLGKKEAFEEWRRHHYKEASTYEQNNRELSEMIKEAKKTGAETNQLRQKVNRLKGEREHIIRQIAANQAAGFDVTDLERKETSIRSQMELVKDEYNATVKKLKELKPNIDHAQHVRERARIDSIDSLTLGFTHF